MRHETMEIMESGITRDALSNCFDHIEQKAHISASTALCTANQLLALKALYLLQHSGWEAVRFAEREGTRTDIDLLWLASLQQPSPAKSSIDGRLVFCDKMSLARPEERPFLAFLPLDGGIMCIASSSEEVDLSTSVLTTTGLSGLEFREITVTISPESFRSAWRGGAMSGNQLFHQIAAEKQLLLSAVILGVAQACFDYVRDYSRKRITFGKAIGHHQAVALKLADTITFLESSRLLCEQVCLSGRTGTDFLQQVEDIWQYILEIPREIAPQMIQLMGGHGYLQQHPVQQWFRDLQLLAVAGHPPDLAGTNL